MILRESLSFYSISIALIYIHTIASSVYKCISLFLIILNVFPSSYLYIFYIRNFIKKFIFLLKEISWKKNHNFAVTLRAYRFHE